jgi:orotate phosphoribosyltransferase
LALCNYKAILEQALATNYITQEDMKTLQEWHKDPSAWGLES